MASLKSGKEIADATVASKLYHRAIGYDHDDVHIYNCKGEVTLTPIKKHYPPDTVACIFWLKNRRPAQWREKIEHTGVDGQPIQLQVIAYAVNNTPQVLPPALPAPDTESTGQRH